MRRIAASTAALALTLALGACGSDDVLPPPTTPVNGGLRLTWTIVDGAGAVRDCASARVETVSIDIGKQPELRPCTDGELTFSNLLPERYPIVAQALSSADIPRDSLMTNGDVTAGATTTVDLQFLVDPTTGDTGDLSIRWRVDSADPRTRCAAVGAETAHITSGGGSIGTFDVSVPCSDAETILRGLRPGTYVAEIALERADGTRIAIAISSAVRVEVDRLADTGNVDVITVPTEPTRLTASWTVNSTAAADACDTVGARNVTIATVPPPGIVSSSTTVLCTRGSATLVGGLGNTTVDVRMSLQYSVASVSSTVVQDVRIRRGQTSTISYDFIAR